MVFSAYISAHRQYLQCKDGGSKPDVTTTVKRYGLLEYHKLLLTLFSGNDTSMLLYQIHYTMYH